MYLFFKHSPFWVNPTDQNIQSPYPDLSIEFGLRLISHGNQKLQWFKVETKIEKFAREIAKTELIWNYSRLSLEKIVNSWLSVRLFATQPSTYKPLYRCRSRHTSAFCRHKGRSLLENTYTWRLEIRRWCVRKHDSIRAVRLTSLHPFVLSIPVGRRVQTVGQ